MAPAEIARRRLAAQHLADPMFDTPEDVVRRLGAVQAQDYAGAKWAVGQRGRGIVDAGVERAVSDGAILRTHVLRPTWHFVVPADIRWMLALTAPRIVAAAAFRYLQLELDAAAFRRSNAALTKALEGGRHRTRAELRAVLERAGIDTTTDSQRVAHLLMRAELDGLLCSGARRGKQHTYALLDEHVPPVPPLEPDEALRELARRYFTSRGPATVHDFAWWSGLTVADGRRGIEMAGPDLEHEVVEGRTYWFAAAAPAAGNSPTANLLPSFDEFFVAFRDRGATVDRLWSCGRDVPRDLLAAHVAIEGQVVGAWKRTLKKDAVLIGLDPLLPLTESEERAIAVAAARYGAFLQLPAERV